MSQPGCIVGILKEDGRLGIRVCDAVAAGLQGTTDDLFGGCFASGNQFAFTRHLRDLPVLTPLTAEIAARRSDGIGQRAGIKMVKRFLFHRIYILADSASIDQGIKDAIHILTHAADTQFAIWNHTVVRT